jgi:hypothetical protein
VTLSLEDHARLQRPQPDQAFRRAFHTRLD